jgi:hypothetical protein
MSFSKTTTQSSVDISSSLTPPSSINSNIPEDAALLIGNDTNSPSLWCSILDTYGKEILECASHPFLDLTMALRLDTISTRDLVCLLSKARRRREGWDIQRQMWPRARDLVLFPTEQMKVPTQVLLRRCLARGQVKAAATPLPHLSPLQLKHLGS